MNHPAAIIPAAAINPPAADLNMQAEVGLGGVGSNGDGGSPAADLQAEVGTGGVGPNPLPAAAGDGGSPAAFNPAAADDPAAANIPAAASNNPPPAAPNPVALGIGAVLNLPAEVVLGGSDPKADPAADVASAGCNPSPVAAAPADVAAVDGAPPADEELGGGELNLKEAEDEE
ncbi:collagen alpha-1(III) chain-like [Brachypodium distachyon]|uniref:Uncharacterized protein n=1 Tax=Brachypodium distachyon TaxID=15368 RepID=A0A2K2D504_BRADI|nr:collagen alpha-1(III) chain-like [Brachypodium distachyon]PNT69346.1 hypothetical protein BRADI_3g54231v3 [Brachypodium distachyon]|eukprot:XP_024317239.1 collagen alpha-1(III) chain-like [Brachypodium distachyon]